MPPPAALKHGLDETPNDVDSHVLFSPLREPENRDQFHATDGIVGRKQPAPSDDGDQPGRGRGHAPGPLLRSTVGPHRRTNVSRSAHSELTRILAGAVRRFKNSGTGLNSLAVRGVSHKVRSSSDITAEDAEKRRDARYLCVLCGSAPVVAPDGIIPVNRTRRRNSFNT